MRHLGDLGPTTMEEVGLVWSKGPHARVGAGRRLVARLGTAEQFAQPSELGSPVAVVGAVEADAEVDMCRHLAGFEEHRDDGARPLTDAAMGGQHLSESRPLVRHKRIRQDDDYQSTVADGCRELLHDRGTGTEILGREDVRPRHAKSWYQVPMNPLSIRLRVGNENLCLADQARCSPAS